MRNMYNTGADEPRAANVWADSKGNGRDARSGGRRGKLLLLTDGLPPGDLSGLLLPLDMGCSEAIATRPIGVAACG